MGTTTTPEPAYHPALSNINTSNCTHTSTRSKLIHYSAASSTTMEASQHNTLQIIQNYVKTPSIEVVPPKTIKMEDITSTTTSSSLLDVPSLDCASRGAESKPTKKRKSWGQVLPEPKTNLPPRKRAKTADEKEQRRIERVKRNRLAAHNSRERKRQEVEALQMRNDQLEAHMQLMQQQIDAYRAQFPDAKVPAVPKLEKMEFDISSPPPTQPTTTPHNTHMAHFINEMPTPAPFSSPDSLLSTIDSPADTAPSTPSTSLMDGTDRTQQSAVSVGFFPINLGGNDNNGKLHLGAQYDHSLQLHDLHDDDNAFIDFALYPEEEVSLSTSNSFFNEGFDGSANRDGFTGGDSSNAFEPFDADHLFDLQPGAGALLRSSDASGIATE